MTINYYQSAHYLIVSLITSLVANKVVLISASSPSCLAHPPVLNAWPSICPGPVGKKLSLPKRCWWVGSILISYLYIFLCLTLYSEGERERALHAVMAESLTSSIGEMKCCPRSFIQITRWLGGSEGTAMPPFFVVTLPTIGLSSVTLTAQPVTGWQP